MKYKVLRVWDGKKEHLLEFSSTDGERWNLNQGGLLIPFENENLQGMDIRLRY